MFKLSLGVVSCVGHWVGVLSMLGLLRSLVLVNGQYWGVVWSMLVSVHDVDVGSMLGFVQSMLGVGVLGLATCTCLFHGPLYGFFVCAWMSTVGPWLFNVGLGVVSCIG